MSDEAKGSSPLTALLPCPFCGADAVVKAEIETLPPKPINVQCGGSIRCPLYGKFFQVEKWNRRASAWQPIESAPKDGTVIRVYSDYFRHADFNPMGSLEAYYQDGQGFVAAVWNAEFDGWNAKTVKPTHWQPLPAPPQKAMTNRSVESEPKAPGNADRAAGLLASMTDDQRLELFSGYCKSCGRDDPGCQCWNDE